MPSPDSNKDNDSPKDDESCADSFSDSCSDPFLLYRSVGYGGIRVYLKCETLSNGRRFCEMDLRKSLKSNLRGRAVVEYPVLHVAMKADECLYREPSDCLDLAKDLAVAATNGGQKEEVKQEHEEGVEDVGQVWDQEDAMQADPAAFRQYFDFYLNYYTQKYARQAGGSSGPLVPPCHSLPPPPAGIPIKPAEESAIPLPEFDQRLKPDLSPFAVVNKGKQLAPPPRQPPPPANKPPLVPREPGPRSRFNYVPMRSAALEQALSVKNKLNEARAQKMREELRKSALVAYDDSDSEQSS